MLQAGTALSVIGPHNSTATTKALEEGLAKPLPTAAELLVSSFLQSKAGGTLIARSTPSAAVMASAAPSRPVKPPPPRPSIVDVLDEGRRIRGEWMAEVGKLQALQQPSQQLQALEQSVQATLHHAEKAVHLAQATRHQLRDELHRELVSVQDRMEHRWAETLHRLAKQNDQILQRLDELLDKVACSSPAAGRDEPFEDPTGV